jgi:hypothetical protein
MTERSPEVTFKYYLPEHQDEISIHFNAINMLRLLNDIDEKCRGLIKWNDSASEETISFAEEIREMMRGEIDISKLL